MFNKRIEFKHQPVANPENVIRAGQVRFTVITDRLIRMEHSRKGQFRDLSTQTFIHRDLGKVDFKLTQTEDHITIDTGALLLNYRINEIGFTIDTLSVEVKATGKTWTYSREGSNLKGTIRTLDGTDGAQRLDDGLMSRDGYALVDDTSSFIFTEDHWMKQEHFESGSYEDLYLFGYGIDYKACLVDFTKVAGQVPMLPRWTMGNWWSRYWRYTQDELIDLMDQFKEKEIPLSVCIVDMDWHITDVNKSGTAPASSNFLGWTGYTWEEKYFPQPDRFFKELRQRGLKTALNLHPADGLWPHESMYNEMADFMGQDSKALKPIHFNITDKRFAEGYFDIMHHPHEDMGVDFWWMDWQQGTKTKYSDIDPLFVLNHLHFLDMGRDNKRPFIFSRWGGLGNHRYPIGFSGDAAATWETLAFQPYLTATAANVAYGWWSHDIGGHHHSFDDGELYARWVQFGVFSPMMRLHSTNNIFEKRLPWDYKKEAEICASKFMKLRHQLIPYLYTLSYKNYKTGIPGFLPMYYEHPDQDEAYHYGNQYYFGDLIVSPFVKKADEHTKLSRQSVWLPEGDWYDFFTGHYYAGSEHYGVYGDLCDMPVFAKSGTIVPLGHEVPWGGIDNPKEMHVKIFAGSGSYELYEDDGDSKDYLKGSGVVTRFEQTYDGSKLTVKVLPVSDPNKLIPETRDFTFEILGIEETIIIEKRQVSTSEGCTFEVTCQQSKNAYKRRKEDLDKVLLSAYIDSNRKRDLWDIRETFLEDATILGSYYIESYLPDSVLTAILETVNGKSIYRMK
ncbi:DUF5110 domain-containing protein [Acidaminobacter sp. JC074]|uniref:glycoside hydrolase family 31 protein n=1 Tax=Acidaminobacter sp. JC074 TaxID=2530199 RepID=UPI001F0D6130|nr:TIM-barrel domain-containing protein [Acidaminobacter sp. JC074]MCH4888598.1 DUF5110 domain-containing protein [Acidaminobacter sp. JC074]